MIIKTEEFMKKLGDDLHWITINRNLPFMWKGSLKLKDYGDVITDADFQTCVYYNRNLLEIVSSVLRKNRSSNSPFTFINMSVGRYIGYEVPWSIDDRGGCQFDPERAKRWFKWFRSQNSVSFVTLKYIEPKLRGDMTIKDLIDIENALHPYAEIIWSEEDIRRGFVIRNGIKYFLLQEMKTETPVLEYLYEYQNSYVGIDVGLVDKNYKVPPVGAMYRFYIQNWYKVLKSMRWKLEDRYSGEYFTEMNKINTLSALKYQVELILKIQKGNILPRNQFVRLYNQTLDELKKVGIELSGRGLMQVSHLLYERINEELKSNVMYFAERLVDENTRSKIILRLKRGAAAQIPSSQEKMRKRHANGIQCPFFPTDMEEYEKLLELSQRIDMNPDHVVNCFSEAAIKLGKQVHEIVNEIVKDNGLSVREEGDDIVLYHQNAVKGRYALGDKSKLQAYVLLK